MKKPTMCTSSTQDLLEWRCPDCDSWTWTEIGPLGIPLIKRAHDESCPTWAKTARKLGIGRDDITMQVLRRQR